jgi:general secretion pathway protein N
MALNWSAAQLSAFGLLTAASVGLAILIYDELQSDAAPVVAGAPASTESGPAAAPESFAMPPLQSYRAVLDRPLFSQNRHPAPPQVASQPLTNPSELVLAGIIITETEKVALIANNHAGSFARYSEGQAVGGWTLQSIQQDRIILTRGANQQEVKLADKARAPTDGAALPRNARRP